MNKDRVSKSRSRNSYEFGSSTELRRGPWTLEEDNLLIQYISCNGEGRWNLLSKCAGLKRTGKSCRLRWLNYLKPDVKRGNLSPHEQLSILQLHSKWGNRWSRIAQHLPGRTDNEIKNYWRTTVQKQARKLKVDSNSNNFLETIRMFWTPKMLEKIEQENSSPLLSSPPMEAQIFTAPSPVISYQGPQPSPCQTKPGYMVNNSDSNSISELSESVINLTGGENSSLEDNSYYVGVPSYDMQELEKHDISVSECYVADFNWFEDDLEGNFWGTDELWEFRKAEEVGF